MPPVTLGDFAAFRDEMVQVVEEYFSAGGPPDAHMPPMAMLWAADGRRVKITLIPDFERGEQENVGEATLPRAIRDLQAEYAALIVSASATVLQPSSEIRDVVQIALFQRGRDRAELGMAAVGRDGKSAPTLGPWEWMKPDHRLKGRLVDGSLRAMNEP